MMRSWGRKLIASRRQGTVPMYRKRLQETDDLVNNNDPSAVGIDTRSGSILKIVNGSFVTGQSLKVKLVREVR